MNRERYAAEQATGCQQTADDLGQFFDGQGDKLRRDTARASALKGSWIEVPNAGAGSYVEVFNALGCNEVKAIETTSSAGDWMFVVLTPSGEWAHAWQENRHPYCGFKYLIGLDRFKTLKAAKEIAFG